MMIDIKIDGLTDCLIENTSGREVKTEYHLLKKKITKDEAKKLQKEGWKFDWSRPQNEGCEVYQLFVQGNSTVQGMIAFRHVLEQMYTFVDIVEASPKNVGKNGEYKGVGAHLFAIACKHSWDVGNEGYVQFEAKTNLIEHYQETLDAHLISDQYMYIDTYGALKLINQYFKEE